MAVQQCRNGKITNGYFDILFEGKLAEQVEETLNIGQEVSITGVLWQRKFRDNKGKMTQEYIVIAKSFENALPINSTVKVTEDIFENS